MITKKTLKPVTSPTGPKPIPIQKEKIVFDQESGKWKLVKVTEK